MEKKSIATIQQLCDVSEANSEQNLENSDLIEDKIEKGHKEDGNDEENIFIWPDKAVMLFLELYREKEHEFSDGQKRHNKLWAEIALELNKSNYKTSSIQVQNKMSSLKRTYKKIKDSNSKSGNHNSSWTFYTVMDSLFGEKAWVSPPAIASSEGPAVPNTLASSSSSSSMDNSEFQESSLRKSKKRRVETILDSFISDIRNDREQIKEEKKKEQLEREKKREQRWENERAERKEMHKETLEVDRSLVHLLNEIVEK